MRNGAGFRLGLAGALALCLATPTRAAGEAAQNPTAAVQPKPEAGAQDALTNSISATTKALKAIASADLPNALKDQDVANALSELLTTLDLKRVGQLPCAAKSGGSETDCRIDRIGAFAAGMSDALGKTVSLAESQALHSALDGLVSRSPANDDTGLIGAIEAAVTVAKDNKAFRVDLIAQSLDNLVKALTTKLVAIRPGDITRNQKLSAKASAADIRKALSAITNTLDPNDRLIRVTGAWYGDLHAISWSVDHTKLAAYKGGDRFCSATGAVRAFCHGKPRCFDSGAAASKPNGDTSQIGGAVLCGYEPDKILYATQDVKALLVQYQCLPADDKLWTETAQRNDYSSYNGLPACDLHRGLSGSACVNYAVLRNGASAIVRCKPDDVATGDAPAGGVPVK